MVAAHESQTEGRRARSLHADAQLQHLVSRRCCCCCCGETVTQRGTAWEMPLLWCSGSGNILQPRPGLLLVLTSRVAVAVAAHAAPAWRDLQRRERAAREMQRLDHRCSCCLQGWKARH